MSSFNLFRAILVSVFLVFTASTAYATEVECKRYDTKCVKAQKKAQFTQAYFKILDAGIKAEWDAKKLRELFTKHEQRELKKIGLDVSNRRLVQAFKKKYQETFSHLDTNAWQSVLDSILHEDYVAKQVKYKLMNVAVVDRLKKELERSSKKTIKAKSGNFSTRSNARSAVVVLEDMRRAQSALMRELSKAGDELDIDVLAEALEETTIILVDRNEKVSKALRNPKELEKILIKASKSTGVKPSKLLGKFTVAAKPAIDVLKMTVDEKIKTTPQGVAMSTKQIKRSESDDVIFISTADDTVVITPDLPDKVWRLSYEEIKSIHANAEVDDYEAMMRSYARYANLEKTDALSKQQWNRAEPGFLYGQITSDIWQAGYNGVVADAMLQDLNQDANLLWSLVSEARARINRANYLLNSEIEIEEKREALEKQLGTEIEDSIEEAVLEDLHAQESKQILRLLTEISANRSAAVLFTNEQNDLINKLFDTAMPIVMKSLGDDRVEDYSDGWLFNHLAKGSTARLAEDLLVAEQVAAGDGPSAEYNLAQSVIVNLSIAESLVEEANQLVLDGNQEQADKLREEAKGLEDDAIEAAQKMVKTWGVKDAESGPVILALEKHFEIMNLNNIKDPASLVQEIKGKSYFYNTETKHRTYNYIEEKFYYEDLNTQKQIAELTAEIQQIQSAIDDIQAEYDKAISMGASPDEAAAYMADQQAQMQQGMQQLCGNGDPNNPNPC